MSPNHRRTTASLAALVLVASAFAVATAGTAQAAPPDHAADQRGGGNSGRPGDTLPERLRGEAAIDALGQRLPEVAARNDMTPGEFVRALRSEDELWVGRSGTLLYVDEDLAETEPSSAAIPELHDDSIPTSMAFDLHSRPTPGPGESGYDPNTPHRVLYLDFDGETAPGAGWSGTPGPAYDLDGAPGSFNAEERRVIIDVWRHVAEDFAPFGIDVTTETPDASEIRRASSGDVRFGTSVVVTPVKTDCDSCGGIAYVGTYDHWSDHDRYQPAWVYIAGRNAKSIAEAASHEAGHNLGLGHDGTSTQGYYSGHGDWAPIMGVGYYEPVSQWSRGEYADANNTQDDFAVAQSNGSLLTADDHGDTVGSGTPLEGPDATMDGLVGIEGDVDVLSFTTSGGGVTFDVTPALTGPNVNLAVQILDQGGAPVAAADPTGTLGASVATTLPAGTYGLAIRGVGEGNPVNTGYSAYGSVGNYTVAGTFPVGVVPQPPTALADAAPVSGRAPLPVDFFPAGSDDVDGTIVSYEWDFGDGQTTTTATPDVVTHTYDTVGTFQASLTVTDDEGLTDTSEALTIEVLDNLAPVAAPTADPDYGVETLTTTLRANATDPEGDALSYAWTLDGSPLSTQPTLQLSLATPGTRLATVTVTDDRGASVTESVVLTVAANEAPTAAIDGDGFIGEAPFTIDFDGSGSTDPNGDELTYAWDFGDGSTSSAVQPSHTFGTVGTFTTTLTVTDPRGLRDTATQVVEVRQANRAPVAAALASTYQGTAPLAVDFTGTGTDADGDTVSYRWTFGDGSESTQRNPSHTYASAGTYDVTLTVTDPSGATGTDSFVIRVDPDPSATPPAAPTNVSASDNSGTVTVSWTDLATNEDGYEIVRESQHKNGRWQSATIVSTTGTGATSITDTPGSGTYRYTVRAFNSYGWSDAVGVVVDATSGGGGGGGGDDTGGGGPGKGKKNR